MTQDIIMKAIKPTGSGAARGAAIDKEFPTNPQYQDAVFLNFAAGPEEIVDVIDEAVEWKSLFKNEKKRLGSIATLLLGIGLLLMAGGVVWNLNGGQPMLVYGLIFLGLSLIGLGILGFILNFSQGKGTVFNRKTEVSRNLLALLTHDTRPKGSVSGWLDATGWESTSKMKRQKRTASGRPVEYYSDEWLRLKLKLVDNNVLRLSMIDKVKSRRGYYKRSRSGKMKWKPGSDHPTYIIKAGLSVNPDLYQVRPFDHSGVNTVRGLVVDSQAVNGNRIDLRATGRNTIDSKEILALLKYLYNHLERVR